MLSVFDIHICIHVRRLSILGGTAAPFPPHFFDACFVFGPHVQVELATHQDLLVGVAREGKEGVVRSNIEKDWERKKWAAEQRELHARVAAAESVVKG